MATQSHGMANTVGGLTATMAEPLRGIRSLTAVIEAGQCYRLKAGGLSASDSGLMSLSTTARRDGMPGFEHCQGPAYRGMVQGHAGQGSSMQAYGCMHAPTLALPAGADADSAPCVAVQARPLPPA